MTDAMQALRQRTALNRADVARQAAAAMKRGFSVLVVGLSGTSDALAEAEALLDGSRSRVLRVRPPYNLTSFMQQLAPGASEDDGSLLDAAYDALAVLDKASVRVVLLAEDAHLMPKTTLRYIESALRNRPHLCVALAGQPELVGVLEQPELGDLRERLGLQLVLAGTPGALAAPSATGGQAPPRRRRAWVLGGVAGLLCIGLAGSQLVDVGRLPFLADIPWLGGPAPTAATPGPAGDAAAPGSSAPSSSAPGPVASGSAGRPGTSVPGPGVPPGVPASPTASPSAGPPNPSVAASVTASVVPGAPAAPPPSQPSLPVPPPVAVVPPVVAPAMVPLPGGEFRMGSNDNQFERPVRTVLVRPFLLAKAAVTVRDWSRCVDAGACRPAADGQPDEPVLNVSWTEAGGYAAWLAQGTQRPFRLPTEAEWEYAARAGATTRYAWGSAMVPGRMSCNGCGGPAGSPGAPPRVDANPPNAFGLLGMGGGVAEWVADCWHRNYQGAPRDGSTPWDAPDCAVRVLRGGGWLEDAGAQRVTARESFDAAVRQPAHGFRVAESK